MTSAPPPPGGPAPPDCLSCGACCLEGSDGRIIVTAADVAWWAALGRDDLVALTVPGHFGERGFASREDGACVHLGTRKNPHACSIYEVRGATCREFPPGCPQCHEFRRTHGVE